MLVFVWSLFYFPAQAASVFDVILAQHPETRLHEGLDLARKKRPRGVFGMEQRSIDACMGSTYRSICKWSPLGQTEVSRLPLKHTILQSEFFDPDHQLYRSLLLRFSPKGLRHELFSKYSKAIKGGQFMTASFAKDISFWPTQNEQLIRQGVTVQGDHFRSRRVWSPLGQEIEAQTWFHGNHDLWIEKEFLEAGRGLGEEVGSLSDLTVSYKHQDAGTQLIGLHNEYQNRPQNRVGLLERALLNGQEILKFRYNKQGLLLQMIDFYTGDWIGFRETVGYLACLGGGMTGVIGNIAFDQDYKMKQGTLSSEIIEVNRKKMKKSYEIDQEAMLRREVSDWADIRYYYAEDGWLHLVRADTKKGRVERSFVRKENDWIIETSFQGQSRCEKVRFDAAGNLIQKGTKHFVIGPQARVVEMTDTTRPGYQVQYHYDEGGFRIRKIVTTEDGRRKDYFWNHVVEVGLQGLSYLLSIEGHGVGFVTPDGFKPMAFDRTGTSFHPESLWWQASSYGPWLAQIMEPSLGLPDFFREARYDEDLEAYAFEKRDFDPFLLRYQSPHESVFKEEITEVNEASLLIRLAGEMYAFSRSNPTHLKLNAELD
jgi:hypothetical protein